MSIMLILYHSNDDVSVGDLAVALAQIPGIRVEQTGPARLTVWEDEWPIRVYVATEGYVEVESQEIAAFAHVALRPDRAALATCDCRIEVMYEPDPDMTAFNTWLLITERLYPLVHGVVYDPENGTFPYDNVES